MKYLFNDHWSFLELACGSDLQEAMEKLPLFVPVPVPHDWLIDDSTDLYRSGTGWYYKRFFIDAGTDTVMLIFDGIYMDSTIYINEVKAGCCPYGYTTFRLDITPLLVPGENTILVQVRYQSPNSRWYTGAGILRDVWIQLLEKPCLTEDNIYISSTKREGGYLLCVQARYTTDEKVFDTGAVTMQLQDAYGRSCDMEPVKEVPGADNGEFMRTFYCPGVQEWSPEHPELYTLRVGRRQADSAIDMKNDACLRIGFRSIECQPDKGLLLNGRHIKLHGVCMHFDLGALGGAFYKEALRRQLMILKRMGVNALRTAHAMPAPAFMDLADEMGFLVMTEAFDMWERPKTTYDYARFFGSWHNEDLRLWVTRDRNHPSLLLWSIGNEIQDTHADPDRGRELTRQMKELVEALDPMHNGLVTFASNWLAWENTQYCADLLKVVGYNYGEKYYELHHQKYPDWVIYGSETSALVQSRGIYHFPLSADKLSDDDGQCSSLGNSAASWGAQSLEECVCVDRDLPWSMGQFLWSGFDYLGEPTPYHSKNSFFGQVDTAGFEKDAYYVWQSVWTDAGSRPMVHIFPYWDHNPGQMIDVRVVSNAAAVELFFNGVSKGRQELNHAPGSGRKIIADYRLAYQPGILQAVGYDRNGEAIADATVRSFSEAAALLLEPDRKTCRCGSGEMIFVTIRALDPDGWPVENAACRIHLDVSGAGKLIGLDNGDSTDYDSMKGTSKRLFSGRLLAMIAPDDKPGQIIVNASSRGLPDAHLVLEAIAGPDTSGQRLQTCGTEEGIPSGERIPYPGERACWFKASRPVPVHDGAETEVPVRAVRIHADDGQLFTSEKKVLHASAQILPENADDREVVFSAVNDKGVKSGLVSLCQNGGTVEMTAKGDGAFRLRCTSRSGTRSIRVISELEYRIEGVGQAWLDPYGFISGSEYTWSQGKITSGNERGAATARDEISVLCFEGLDFGNTGADTITIPIFTLTDEPYPVEIWGERPDTPKASLLLYAVYQKKSIYNVYQPITWRLTKRLQGVTGISFRVHQKMHIKGFSFARISRFDELVTAGSADQIYGDSFVPDRSDILQIGNNVTIVFEDEDASAAEEPATYQLEITGRTNLDMQPVRIEVMSGTEKSGVQVQFARCEDWTTRTFTMQAVSGIRQVTFLFLPGSSFDFRAFRLVRLI